MYIYMYMYMYVYKFIHTGTCTSIRNFTNMPNTCLPKPSQPKLMLCIHSHKNEQKYNSTHQLRIYTDIPTIIDPSATKNHPRTMGSIIVGISVLHHTYIHTYIHTCMHTYMHAYIHIYIYIYVYICIYMYMCVCVYIYIYIYICMYIYGTCMSPESFFSATSAAAAVASSSEVLVSSLINVCRSCL
jgi:hypothetical protein